MKTSALWFFRLVAVLMLLGFAQSSYADSTFDFSFSGTGVSASGTLTATLVSGDQFLVTGITGTQNGTAMVLLPPGSFGMGDNHIFSAAPFLDLLGLNFSVGGTDFNTYYDSTLAEYLECNNSGGPTCPAGSGTLIQFSLSSAMVPEPSALLLLGTGLLGLGTLVRRRLGSI